MMDLAIKKAVELGVSRIVPFFSSNVVVKLNEEKDVIKKVEKLNKIVIDAVKQCGRNDIPKVENPIKLKDITEELVNNKFNIFAYEQEEKSIKDVLSNLKNESSAKKIGVIVGPEGGFTQEEAKMLQENANVYSVSLGSRILRAETASMNLLSIINYEFEK